MKNWMKLLAVVVMGTILVSCGIQKVREEEIKEGSTVPVVDSKDTLPHEELTKEEPVASSPKEDPEGAGPLAIMEVSETFYMGYTGNLRKGPGLHHDVLQVIYKGAQVDAVAYVENGWYQVVYQGEQGYLSEILMTKEAPVREVVKEPVIEPTPPREEAPPVEAFEEEEPEEPEEESFEVTLAEDEVFLPDVTGLHRREISSLGLKAKVTEVPHDGVPYGTVLEMISPPGIYKKESFVEIKVAVATDKAAYFANYDRSLQENYPAIAAKALEEEVLVLLNAYRAEHGLAPLTLKEDLQSSARYKSTSMLQVDYFAHINPHLEYLSFGEMMQYIFSYTQYVKMGENLFAARGKDNSTAAVIMEGWKNSPTHNAAMLSPDYQFVGIGIVTSVTSGPFYQGRYVTLATQHFAQGTQE